MKKISLAAFLISVIAVLAACSNTPKLASESMPRSGFLPNYSLLVPTYTIEAGTMQLFWIRFT